MIRWMWGFLWRGFLFWSIWMGGLFFLLLGVAELDPIPPGLIEAVIRLTLFVSVSILLFREWSVLNRALLRATKALQEVEEAVPPRWEWRTHGCVALGLAIPTWGVLLIGLSILWGERFPTGDFAGVMLIRTAVCTISSLLLLTLTLGGVSLMRFRAALRRLPAAARPQLPALLPWTVAAWSTGCLAFVLLGFPSLRTILVGGQLALFAAHLGSGPGPGDVELIVELGEDDSIEEVLFVIVLHGARLWPAFPEHAGRPDIRQTWRLTVPARRAESLRDMLREDRENVDYIELNTHITLVEPAGASSCDAGWRTMPVNDPLSGGQHALSTISGETLLSQLGHARPDKIAVVGVIDTGVDGTHPDLRSVMRPVAAPDDPHGHGTMVAGLIGAVGNNQEGLTSFNLSGQFIALRSYPAMANGRGDALRIADAILDATEDGVDVINMSFGASGPAPRVVAAAVEDALEEGVVVVASAGNNPARRATEQWPANLSGVIVVGALKSATQQASFSSPLSGITHSVLAPGQDVCSLRAGGGYQRYSGTSVAAPLVAGMLGVARSLCPSLPASSGAYVLTGYDSRLDASGFINRLSSRCP